MLHTMFTPVGESRTTTTTETTHSTFKTTKLWIYKPLLN